MLFHPPSLGEIAFSAFPAEGKFPAEGGWLRGVVQTEAASAVVDVRAWVAGSMIYGFCDRMRAGPAESPESSAVGFVLFLCPRLDGIA